MGLQPGVHMGLQRGGGRVAAWRRAGCSVEEGGLQRGGAAG